MQCFWPFLALARQVTVIAIGDAEVVLGGSQLLTRLQCIACDGWGKKEENQHK